MRAKQSWSMIARKTGEYWSDYFHKKAPMIKRTAMTKMIATHITPPIIVEKIRRSFTWSDNNFACISSLSFFIARTRRLWQYAMTGATRKKHKIHEINAHIRCSLISSARKEWSGTAEGGDDLRTLFGFRFDGWKRLANFSLPLSSGSCVISDSTGIVSIAIVDVISLSIDWYTNVWVRRPSFDVNKCTRIERAEEAT